MIAITPNKTTLLTCTTLLALASSLLVVCGALSVSTANSAAASTTISAPTSGAASPTTGKPTAAAQQQQLQITTPSAASKGSPAESSSSSPIVLLASGNSQQSRRSAAAAAAATTVAAAHEHTTPGGASRDASQGAGDAYFASAMHRFDGKDPFADESLWQLPVQLVRDLAAGGGAVGEPQVSESADSAAQSKRALADLDGDAGNADPDEKEAARPGAVLLGGARTTAGADLKTAAGYHYPHAEHAGASHYGGHQSHGDHYGGKYFQYVNVPYPYAYEFGYRRGNPYHTIERHEHAKGPHFRTKVKWSDKKYGGYGLHVWDYNHDDDHHHSKHGHYNDVDKHGHADGYGHDDKHYPAHGASHYAAAAAASEPPRHYKRHGGGGGGGAAR